MQHIEWLPTGGLMVWYIEPGTRRGNYALILLRDGKRYVCPLINSLRWSVQALLNLSEEK